MLLYSFLKATLTKNHVPGPLKQQTFMGSLFWRLGIRDHGVCGHPPSEAQSGDPSLPLQVPMVVGNPWLTPASLQSLPVVTGPVLPLCPCPHFLLQTQAFWMKGPPETSMTSS